MRLVVIEYMKTHSFNTEIGSIDDHVLEGRSWKPIYVNQPVSVQKGKNSYLIGKKQIG